MIGERAYVTLRQRPVSSYNARMGSLDRRLDDLKRRRRQPPTRKTAPARAEARRLSDVVGGRRATCQGMPFWRLTAPFRQVDRASRSPTKAFREPLYCEVARGEFPAEDNVLVNAPHTIGELVSSEWTHPYTREKAAYPLEYLRREHKFWPSVARVNNAYGDRHLVCTCPPMEAYEEEESVTNG